MRLLIGSVAWALAASASGSDARLEALERLLSQQQKTIEALKAESVNERESSLAGFEFSSYGSVALRNAVIYQNTQDTEGNRRTLADLERVVTEFGYRFNEHWKVEVEIEYEHGGTGATLEYDGFEEFGEFESEVEAGGEIIIEKAQVEYTPSALVNFKLGRIHVPVGMTTALHKPTDYLTASRHRSVESMIPAVWHETGVGVFGAWDQLHYQAQLITGLNSEYFRSYGWVSTGHQRRFETVNADDPAIVLNLDWGDLKSGSAVGASVYFGNTSGNRHKANKLDVDGALMILDLHAAYVQGPWILRAQYLYGELEDADAITLANKTTPGLTPGNFAQVGSESEAWFVEAGTDLGKWFGWQSSWVLHANYEHSNPVKATQSGTGTARFDRDWLSLGLNYQPLPQLIFKSEFGREQVAQDNIPDSNFVALSLGYQFEL
ncbi:hypothetical protein [Ferrimonas marina]|uniref:Phosphate-selective porin O and P n=1 Tax=Ferrimonas marina TaxID=299255 RepID=A0A1M5RTR5_9GAMM|nr:hypothetical protein [Ferrimonas marina]SHH29697.1 hypothetical protein SAMN02745129_1750 [Ferrimonas marina]